jgi:hypothetical protein
VLGQRHLDELLLWNHRGGPYYYQVVGYHSSRLKGQQREYDEVYEGPKVEVRGDEYLEIQTEDAMKQEWLESQGRPEL